MAVLFDELLLDPDIFSAGGATGGPEYANTIVKNPQTGVFKVNVGRYDFQQVWNMDVGLLPPTDLDYFMEFWGGGFGSGYGFRLVVVSDFFVIDEAIGTGDGVQTVFNLTKSYIRPGANHSYVRRIVKPVVNLLVSPALTLYEPNGVTPRVIPTARGIGRGVPAFTVKKQAVTVTNYTINNSTGVITFAAAPPAGHVITWSGEFDCPARFLQNSFALKPDIASDISGLQIVEILPAELGIT